MLTVMADAAQLLDRCDAIGSDGAMRCDGSSRECMSECGLGTVSGVCDFLGGGVGKKSPGQTSWMTNAVRRAGYGSKGASAKQREGREHSSGLSLV